MIHEFCVKIVGESGKCFSGKAFCGRMCGAIHILLAVQTLIGMQQLMEPMKVCIV